LVKKPQIFSGFLSLGQLTLDMGVFIWSMGSPNCKDIEIAMGEGFFEAPDSTLFWVVLRGLGAWMTLKKFEMDKTLRNASSITETDLLNHKWLDFAI
jgi:hypothetical protein